MNAAEIVEVFQTLGAVTVRRLFSGKGIYHQGLIVAVEIGGELRLKADAISAPAFEAAGATRWCYDGRRGPTLMPYWSIPAEAFDDPDVMCHWTRLAYEAALRSQTASSGR